MNGARGFFLMFTKSNRGFFAYHPQTEKRLGPRALRMTIFKF